jgi:hypothetical protein
MNCSKDDFLKRECLLCVLQVKSKNGGNLLFALEGLVSPVCLFASLSSSLYLRVLPVFCLKESSPLRPPKFKNKIKLISYGIPGINPKPKKLIH